jgi:DNA-binding CsgD family transcriptional regulator
VSTPSTKRLASSQIPTVSPEQSEVGFVLTNRSLNPIYANSEAAQILAYPYKFEKIRSQRAFLYGKTRSVLPKAAFSLQSPTSREVISGNRRYVCRVFPLNPYAENSSEHVVALLFERTSSGPYDIRKVCEKYHLTPREQQAVEFLVQGLVSKEIAERMEISANTVKAFFRLVMVKMGVANRAGIMAKLLRAAR